MLQSLEAWFADLPTHDFMVQTVSAFPACESLHFIGLSMLFGSLLLVDLRGLGFFRSLPLLELHRLVPVALAGFVINAITGFLFISFDPTPYFDNAAFLTKMALIPIAGINALVFEFYVFRPLKAGDVSVETGTLIKVSSGLSLLLWAGVLIGGRLIPFV